MTSLNFSGSPWFLLLLVPGLFILWRQYRGDGPGRGGGRGRVLMLLQLSALLLLVVSLTEPEWVRRHAEFHNPSVLILRDRSGSFQSGAYLGLGEAYGKAEEAVAETYRSRRFDVLIADFNEKAWPVSGFKGKAADGKGMEASAQAADAPLTSLAALADFLDSAAGPNLQAAFLFSDGRANLDSGKASRNWPVPVYPVVLPVSAVSEVQPERVSWASMSGEGEPDGLEVAWAPVGPVAAGPALRILRGGKAVFAAELPLAGDQADRDLRISKVPWKPPAGLGRLEALRAVVQPAGGRGNFDPFNDTLAVTAAGSRGERRLLVLKPLRSLDEKGMMDLFNDWDEARIEMIGAEELPGKPLTAKDQVWVEAGALAARGGLLKALRETQAKVVVYARPGGLPAEIAGIKVKRQEFSPGAEVRSTRSSADVFPDGVVRLKSIGSRSLEAPASEGPWREAAVLTEGGRRGLLMGWFPLGPGKEAFFLSLPPLWTLLFDPQADFATRANLGQILRAASLLADREEGAVKAAFPRRAFAGIPFDLEFTVPTPLGGGDSGALELVIGAAGGAPADARPLSGPGPETHRLEALSLPPGRFTLSLMRGGERIWRDSLEVAAKSSLELARIGFDRAALLDLAGQSGGHLIAPGSVEPSQVIPLLPALPGAQIKVERTQSTRLYNTRWQFLLAVILLTASWLLRKRWDYD